MKANNPAKTALNQILAEFKNKVIATRSTNPGGILSEEESIQVLSRMSKQRRESIEEFTKADRKDLVEKEEMELRVIETFLPQQMSAEEITELVKSTAERIGVVAKKDIGLLMQALNPLTKGKADGKLVATKVKEFLV